MLGNEGSTNSIFVSGWKNLIVAAALSRGDIAYRNGAHAPRWYSGLSFPSESTSVATCTESPYRQCTSRSSAGLE